MIHVFFHLFARMPGWGKLACCASVLFVVYLACMGPVVFFAVYSNSDWICAFYHGFYWPVIHTSFIGDCLAPYLHFWYDLAYEFE